MSDRSTDDRTQSATYENGSGGTQQQFSETALQRIIEATVQRAEQRPQRISPMDLKTFAEIEAFAERAAKTNMVPRDYLGKPDNIILAVMKGKEIGLPPMASLESIAIINGRTAVWGPAVAGVCMATGLVADVVERYEGEGDDFAAVCTVIRKGMSPREGRFSIRDAKQAGLHGKDTHGKYPKLMQMWRARQWAWTSAFPDVLRGLGFAEIEAEEAARPQWTMPQPSRAWFERKPTSRRTDGWDDTWFRGFVGKLAEEQNAWRWMHLLFDGLEQAPTLRDVDELDELPMVEQVVGAAPPDARADIDAAFGKARLRFSAVAKPASVESKPAKAAKAPPAAKPAQTETPKEPPPKETPVTSGLMGDADASTETDVFDYCVLDERGEPTGPETYPDAVAWATAFLQAARASSNIDALTAQNADGIQDACATDPRAATLLVEYSDQAEHQETPELRTVEVSITRGRSDWTQYHRDFTAELGQTQAAWFYDWLAAQEPVVKRAPASTRLTIVKAIVTHAANLGVAPPANYGVTPTPPEEEATETPAEKPDRDLQTLERLQAEIDAVTTEHELRAFSNAQTTAVPVRRWEQERPELHAALKTYFDAKQAALRGRTP